ncbi:MAG: recombinase family protein [Propionibacteriaceae bacterium]
MFAARVRADDERHPRGRRDPIVCWDTDRLTRQLRELADLIDLGAPIGTVSGELDLSSSSGRLVATILGGVAPSGG